MCSQRSEQCEVSHVGSGAAGAVNPVGCSGKASWKTWALGYGWDLGSRREAQQLKVPVSWGRCWGQVCMRASLGYKYWMAT